MPTGPLGRRFAKRVWVVALLAIPAGCSRLAVRPAAPAPASTMPSAPTPVASVPREVLNRALPDPDQQATPPAEAPEPAALALAEPAAPTPMLDAALERAEALKATVAGEVAHNEPAPATVALPPLTTLPPIAIPPEPSQPATGPPNEASVPTEKALPDLAPAVDPVPAPVADPKAPTMLPEPATTPPAEAAVNEAPTPAGPVVEVVAPPEVIEAPLQISALRLCRKVRGFGDVDPWTAPRIRPGQSVIVYSELSGVHYEEAGERVRSRIAGSAEWFVQGAQSPVRREALGLAEDTADRPRHEFFVGYVVTVPATLPPGSYQLRVTQVDEVGQSSDSRSVPLVVER